MVERWAKTLPCTTCGAPLPVRLASDRVRCDFCRIDSAVPADLLAEAREQLARIRAANEAEREELERARVSRRRARSTRATVVWVVVFAVLCVAWVPILVVLDRLGAVTVLALVAITALTVNRMIFGLAAEVSTPPAWDRERAKPPSRDAVTFAASCEACGGEAPFAEGRSETVCPFCAATLVAPRAVNEASLAKAADRTAVARVLSRAEQEKALATYDAMVAPGVALAFVGAGAMTALVVWGALSGPSRTHVPPSAMIVGLPVAITAAVALVFVQRR